MNTVPDYDNELEYPIEADEDPYGERTVYNVSRATFKNSRKNEKNEENYLLD